MNAGVRCTCADAGAVLAAPGPSAVHLFQFLPRAGQDGMKFEMTGQMTGDSVKHTTQQQEEEDKV